MQSQPLKGPSAGVRPSRPYLNNRRSTRCSGCLLARLKLKKYTSLSSTQKWQAWRLCSLHFWTTVNTTALTEKSCRTQRSSLSVSMVILWSIALQGRKSNSTMTRWPMHLMMLTSSIWSESTSKRKVKLNSWQKRPEQPNNSNKNWSGTVSKILLRQQGSLSSRRKDIWAIRRGRIKRSITTSSRSTSNLKRFYSQGLSTEGIWLLILV